MSSRFGFSIALPLALVCLGATGCKTLSNLLPSRGQPAAPAVALAGFDSIDLTGALSAEVTVGPAFAVAIDGDPALARQVNARVDGQTLLVALAGGDPQAPDRVRVRIALPKLQKVQATGARLTLSGPVQPRLEVAARAGSAVTLANVDGGRLFLEASDGSRVVVGGTADLLAFSLAGGSRGDARQLKVRTVRVSLTGASRLDVRPDLAVSGKASEGSMLAVWNKPRKVAVATRGDADINYVR